MLIVLWVLPITIFSKEFMRNYNTIWEGSGPSALLIHKRQTRNTKNETIAPASDAGEKTPFEDDVNQHVYVLEGTQTAPYCKQQRGKVPPELQALMATAQRLVGCV